MLSRWRRTADSEDRSSCCRATPGSASHASCNRQGSHRRRGRRAALSMLAAPGHGAVSGRPATHEIISLVGEQAARPKRKARQWLRRASTSPNICRWSALLQISRRAPAAGRLAAPDPRSAGGAAVDAIHESRSGQCWRSSRTCVDRPDDGKSADHVLPASSTPGNDLATNRVLSRRAGTLRLRPPSSRALSGADADG